MMKPFITIVATAHQEKGYQCPLVDAMLNQTNIDGWKLLIYHNGPNQGMKEWIQGYEDERITYTESLMDTGQWGTNNRADALERLVDTAWICNTSIQDYYIPTFIEYLSRLKDSADFISWRALNHLFNYCETNGEVAFAQLDWGQWATKTILLQSSGIQRPKEFSADWFTVEKLYKTLIKKPIKLDKILTIHN